MCVPVPEDRNAHAPEGPALNRSVCALMARSVWLFDLDGTLIDSSAGIVRAFHSAQKHFGETPAEADKIRKAIGYPLQRPVAELTNIPFDPFLVEFRKEAMSTMHLDAKLLPGVLDLLATIRKQGRKVALVTAKRGDNARRILNHLNVFHHFDAIVGDDEAVRGKPDAAPVHAALRLLQESVTDAVFIGDTRIDIQCGRASGVPVVALGSGFEVREDLTEADLFMEDAVELKSRFKECLQLTGGGG